MEKLTALKEFSTDKAFQAKWAAVKRQKKAKLAELIKKVRGQRGPAIGAWSGVPPPLTAGRRVSHGGARRASRGVSCVAGL